MTISIVPSQQLEKTYILATLCSELYDIFVLSLLGP
jgi:hypothetical protein